MERSSKRRWAARASAAALAFALGASASAGTLYSWKTEDGTFAYTNDKKRIPSKYKGEAETSTLGKMEKYERFTPGPKVDDKAYADRIVERLEVLRSGGASAVTSSGGEAAPARPYVRLGVNQERTDIEIPVDDGQMAGEPVVVEHLRVKKSGMHQSTRHIKVVRQGDKVLAVIKDSAHDRSPSGDYRESDFE